MKTMQRKLHLLCVLGMVCTVSAIEPVTLIAISRAVTSVVLKGSETVGYGVPLGGSSRVCYKGGFTVSPKNWNGLFMIQARVARMRVANLMVSGLLLQTLATWFILAEEQGVWLPILICDVAQQIISTH